MLNFFGRRNRDLDLVHIEESGCIEREYLIQIFATNTKHSQNLKMIKDVSAVMLLEKQVAEHASTHLLNGTLE